MSFLSFCLSFAACRPGESGAEVGSPDTFTLMVYNVENLFDIDGVALFDEYRQDAEQNPYPYSARKLLTKIHHHSAMIAACNDGKGPDILAIEEFENDFTQDPTFDLDAMLTKYAGNTVAELLGGETATPDVSGLPVEFFLLKRLQELGLSGYHFYQPRFDPSWYSRGIAHRSVFLSRFEAMDLQQFPLEDARDILGVTFDVHGYPFTVFNNHWKSGASSPRSEPTRVQNAGVMRSVLDVRLTADPTADIVLVGDFNSHHNQALRMAGPVDTTGMNGVLRSQSSEQALLDGRADLYNLWYELPQPQRGSEVWAGEWGTLMQIIVTPGLYDQKGIQYVDGSFHRLAIAGANLGQEDKTPVAWVNLGDGAGYSDHLPVYATFRFEDEPHAGVGNMVAYTVSDLGHEVEQEHLAIPVDYSLDGRTVHPNPEALAGLDRVAQANLIGQLYRINGLKQERAVEIEGVSYDVYAPTPDVRDWFNAQSEGEPMQFVGAFGIHRGRLQFVIEDISWTRKLHD